MPETDALDAGRRGVTGQFLVGKAGAGIFPGLKLPIEQFPEERNRLRSALQGEAKVGRHLTHIVVLGIACKDLQVFVERVAGLAFLQKLFGAFYASGNLGSVHSLDRIGHEKKRVMCGVTHHDFRGRFQDRQRAQAPARITKVTNDKLFGRKIKFLVWCRMPPDQKMDEEQGLRHQPGRRPDGDGRRGRIDRYRLVAGIGGGSRNCRARRYPQFRSRRIHHFDRGPGLGELSSMHPAAGSFGVYGDIYLNQWAGFIARAGYWAALAISIGAEMVASATYLAFWFPSVPALVWVRSCQSFYC